MSTLIKLRRDTAANWAATDPVLQLGEPGYDTTNNELRIGDGTTAWSGLTPIAGGGGGGNTFSAITMTATPGGASNQIKYGIGNLVVYNDGGWTIGEYDSATDTYGATGMRINPGIEGQVDINLPADSAANVTPLSISNFNTGNVTIRSNNSYWTFGNDGKTVPPALTVTRGDISSGTISGYTLNIGDGAQEAIITTPNGVANVDQNSQRIVINPGAGADTTGGEGGDIYLWAGRGGDVNGNGGDVKVRGGFGPGNGQGGYIRLEAGDVGNVGTPGYVYLRGGDANFGSGGYVTLQGGYGGDGTGGAINIQGGDSGNGDLYDGNVNIQTGGHTWTFDNTGNLVLPSGTPSINYANGNPFSGAPVNTGNVTFDDNVVIGTGDMIGGGGLYLAPGIDSPGNLQYLRVRGGDYPTHIHLDTGNNQYFDQYFGDDGKFVKLANTGNIEIRTDDFLGNGAQWTFDTAGNITLPTGGAIQTAPGSSDNILIHPDGSGAVIIQGGASTLLTLSSDLPDTQNKLEIDTYGANLGSLGGGVFVGVYRRTDSATLADDRLAQFGGKGTVDGVTAIAGAAGRVAVDAAFNWAPGDTPTHISFWTTAVGQSTPVEVARVGAGQNFTLYAGNLTVGNGRVTSNLVNTVTRTVSALPLPANAGAGSRMFVTDADSRTWGNIVVGGAGNAVPVWCDGTDWYIG